MKKTGNKMRKFWRVLGVSFCCFLLAVAFLAYFSAKWYANTYGQLGFDSILYTLFSGLNGMDQDLINRYLSQAALPAVFYTAVLGLFLFFAWDKKLVLRILPKFRMVLYPVRRSIAVICSLVFTAGLIYQAAEISQFSDYLVYLSKDTVIYQEQGHFPTDVQITFPEEKRNLIYIFLESMENTFFSTEEGGALATNVIPELYDLAENNVSFSHNAGIGGLYAGSGGSWTVGAMVSHLSGIPMKTPPGLGGNDYGQEDVFLPGVTTLTDILHENGYYQALMVGSDAAFGGRDTLFETHGTDKIYDVYTAREDGLIPSDYYVWWGMEDLYLYRYAQQELTKMAAKDQPFAFYMLTVDTHHVGGYVCALCGTDHENQYENVYSCASKQLIGFLEWLQEQDFYENTTIVIVGDHPSMDREYINTVGATDFDRRVYNCILNSAVQPNKTTERTAFTLDMFPTTLAAMGCAIEGDRLGLGTNLFSEIPTLGEEMGLEGFDKELMKNSSYYTKNFFFPE